MSPSLSMCNGPCIKCSLYSALVVQCPFWMMEISWFIICSLFCNCYYTHNDNLRSMKGHPAPSVAPRILFLSHLLRRDGATSVVAMCHVLIGWTRLLVFSHLSILEAFIILSLSSFLFIFPIFSISTFLPFFELRPICTFFFFSGMILSSSV